jgi:hypothetical protein
MITLDQYFAGYGGHIEITNAHRLNAAKLLARVNGLLALAEAAGIKPTIHRNTHTEVSTSDGGWRPQSCPIGAALSSHKQGMAVDVCDVGNHLDSWITDKMLEDAGLYREAPTSTNNWCHLTTRAPGSGRRTFVP